MNHKMMFKRNMLILAIALLLPLSTGAQKRKKRIAKKPVVEMPQEDPRLANIREMTQQIIIIDSIVADKIRCFHIFIFQVRRGESSAVMPSLERVTAQLSLLMRWVTRPISANPMTVCISSSVLAIFLVENGVDYSFFKALTKEFPNQLIRLCWLTV